jgi:hypothetical protein
LKPDGPIETRGEFQPIGTNVSGLHISEHFPLIAGQADKLAIIRSVSQEDNNHSTGAHAGLTGRRHELKAENFGARDTDFPHFGSVLSKLRPNQGGLPTFVGLPEIIATTAGAVTPGQSAGLLGSQYDPFRITDHPDRADFSVESLRLPNGIDDGRMRDRRRLLSTIDDVARLTDRSTGVAAMDSYYQQALNMVLSSKARKAFDLSMVSDKERWRYGWHTFGQSVLLARRLIESGVKLVTVYWHREKRTVDSTWDTHSVNFVSLKQRLMPSVDRPIAALLEDLESRGLLDETLVVWNSEFGRTPKINRNAGRDHWGPCNSAVMAGGGVPGGQVYGATDAQAAYPISHRVTQDDIAATIYHLLGFQPDTMIHDRLNRPLPVALGEPIPELLGGHAKPKPTPNPPTIVRAEVGPFTSMLMQRGNRFLTCDFGNRASEKPWKVTNWSQPAGDGLNRSRRPLKEATIKYLGHFYGHFDYGFLVLRLAKPHTLKPITISLNGRSIPIPNELLQQPASQVWQIPFPVGLIKSTKSYTLKIEAAGLAFTDLALVGERIEARHLRELDAT